MEKKDQTAVPDKEDSVVWYNKIESHLKSSGSYSQFLEEFGNSKTDEERVRYLYKQPIVHEVIKPVQKYATKSANESVSLRNVGNSFFQKKEYKKALDCYSKSVLKAPISEDGEPSLELALAFANRSAVLFHMKLYQSCLLDVQLALKHSYPEHLKYKLFEREGRCHFQLRHKEEAVKSFNKALSFLEKTILEEEKKAKITTDIQQQLMKCDNLKACKKLEKTALDFNRFHEAVPCVDGEINKVFPCASESVGCRESVDMGRGIFAEQDINVGEVLIVEKPFTSVVIKDHRMTHCAHCCNRVLSPLPCQQCSGVVYCSHQCRIESWDSYHYAECKYLDAIQDAQLGLGHLALRMVIKAGDRYLSQYKMSEPDPKGFNDTGVYDSNNYNTVYQLVNHSESRTTEDLLKRTISAVFLLKCLEKTAFFTENVDNEAVDKQEHSYIGGHILRHIQMLPCNAHEVSELALKPGFLPQSETIEVGSAIYPMLSLFNSSCDPAVVRHSYGDKCVVRAIKNITKGQEIFDNYGALYPITERSERISRLSPQYHFECSCVPCQEDWPLYFDIPNDIPSFKCTKCPKGSVSVPSDNKTEMAKCSVCHTKQDITNKIVSFYRSGQSYRGALENVLRGEKLDEALPVLEQHLQFMFKYLCQPWRDVNDCQESIKQCYAVKANCFIIDS